jgi:PknH-like extracellular domain
VTYNGTTARACAVSVVIATSFLLSGCVSTVSGIAVRAQNSGPVGVPQLDESKLDDVMLSIGELNTIVGSTQMEVTLDVEEMGDHSAEVSDPACLGSIYGAEELVYEFTDWTAMRDQVAREPDEDNDHWVEQTAVIYPSAERAQEFFDASKSSWEDCAGSAVSVADADASYLWQLDDVTTEDALIAQFSTQEDADGWGCEHALSVVSNLTVETWACGYSITDEATIMARDMIANAAEE